ncbi:histidinol dehydrogenase [Microbacterium sp. 13-71-7]|uniref:histidinol dehydrogenase n=1 Tax=Microbacterium sp. 13-71-7 TaxID=1970399 RepID=UPI000BDD08AF|nr:histidinol dehydrogenase [Microbacterium sp. 13-71-7]OZB80295.1 MAG: histidinol dehydrogenase [Microbacterium sp. 13-71-7]
MRDGAERAGFRVVDLRGQAITRAGVRAVLPRAVADLEAVIPAAAATIAAVRTGGFAALAAFAARFDGVEPAALQEVIVRSRRFAAAQLPPPVLVGFEAGAQVSLNWFPIERAGVYVPGGKAVYPSSVVMNVVPAQVAGVASIALVSPPQAEHGGLPHPTILATAAMLGIQEVYAIGGAQAIAALAYGVEDEAAERRLAPVDVITGPGNVHVAAAKRLVRGTVAIDMEAGATEVMILADALADPVLIAADLVCQAEHDELAAAILVTDSMSLAAAVQAELARQAAATPNATRVRAALAGAQSGIVLVDDLDQAIRVCDAYAPEHLEVHSADADGIAGRIRNAGAIFIGATTPVSLGDYCAGSNHVLPTGGTATHASGLTVHSFLRAVQTIRYPEAALERLRDAVQVLSDAELLPAHGAAVQARFGSRRRTAVRTSSA